MAVVLVYLSTTRHATPMLCPNASNQCSTYFHASLWMFVWLWALNRVVQWINVVYIHRKVLALLIASTSVEILLNSYVGKKKSQCIYGIILWHVVIHWAFWGSILLERIMVSNVLKLTVIINQSPQALIYLSTFGFHGSWIKTWQMWTKGR